MKVHGLEGALVSYTKRQITSLYPGSSRSCILKVAGPGALLVSKVHKIHERLEGSDERRRLQLQKDAFDIYRLLSVIDTGNLASELRHLGSHPLSSEVTSEALLTVEKLFGSRSDAGTDLLVRSVRAIEENPEFIIESSVALAHDLLEALSS